MAVPGSAVSPPLPSNFRRPALVLIELERLLLDRLTRVQAVESRLARAAARRRSLAGRLAVRQIERDRQRVARELHTGVGQLLACIRIQLELIDAVLPAPPGSVRSALTNIGALAADALDQVRSVSHRLYPPAWLALPLEQALRRLWDASGVPNRYTAVFDVHPLPRDPDPDIKTLIYRAAQEALANIVRHANASRVNLTLHCDSARLVLTVQDDGVGFDAVAKSAGLGLRALNDHAASLGGRLVVHGGPQGATVELSVPLNS